jgi:predicted transcriptional regulator
MSGNYTCSNLAAHLEGVSHDAVSDYLRQDKLTPRVLWEQVQPLLNNREDGYLLVDDSVQNKHAVGIIGLPTHSSCSEALLELFDTTFDSA